MFGPFSSMARGNPMTEQFLEQYEYDEQGDVLDVYFGEKRPAWTIELTGNIMVSIDRQTGQVVALSFLDFTELIRPTPLGARSFPLTGLTDLPLVERNLVLKALITPPLTSGWMSPQCRPCPIRPLPLHICRRRRRRY